MENNKHDIGLTHIALYAKNLDQSICFYSKYANMVVVHERVDASSNVRVVWLSDKTRPFVIVLIENENPSPILDGYAHLGVGCSSKQEVDELCGKARLEGVLTKEPMDSGYPIGYWAFLKDPDGHTLEVSFGQEVGFTVNEKS